MGALTVIGSGVGAYIMGMAALSPCPLLVNDSSGDVIIVSALLNFIYSINYSFNLPVLVLLFEIKCKTCWKHASITSFFSSGVGLDHLRSHSVLCEGDHRGDPAWWGPQCPGVVWSCSAVRLSAGRCDHVSTGQCVQLLLIRRPMQHKMSLSEDIVQKRLEADAGKARRVSTRYSAGERNQLKNTVCVVIFCNKPASFISDSLSMLL